MSLKKKIYLTCSIIDFSFFYFLIQVESIGNASLFSSIKNIKFYFS